LLGIPDTVVCVLHHAAETAPVRVVVLRAGAQQHVVVHVFPAAFVPVERVNLPPAAVFETKSCAIAKMTGFIKWRRSL